jgi:hypothetical protein
MASPGEEKYTLKRFWRYIVPTLIIIIIILFFSMIFTLSANQTFSGRYMKDSLPTPTAPPIGPYSYFIKP